MARPKADKSLDKELGINEVETHKDPATGRRLYTRDCRDLLAHQMGANVELSAAHLRTASAADMLQRLSRNLRQLHLAAGEPLAALKDAQRVLELGPPSASDHLARADLYHVLDCPQAGGAGFDDRLVMLSPKVLIQQMVQAQRLP